MPDCFIISRRTGIAYSNGVRSKIEFQPNDFVSAITHNLPPAKPLKYTYRRNKLGEVVSQQVSDPSLLAPAGLEQSRHYVTNNLNQYTQVGTDTLQHDGNGNLIEFAINRTRSTQRISCLRPLLVLTARTSPTTRWAEGC